MGKSACVKSAAVFLVAGIMMAGYFFVFKNSARKEIKIENEIAENNFQRGSISLDQNDQKRSNLDKENPEVVPEEVKNNNPETKIDNQDKTETAAEKIAPADKINISSKFVSWGYKKTYARKIDTIIIHSTYNALGGDPFSLDKILDIYKSYGVSPHYIIDRSGKIYRLVADENIAYHAGESRVPDGRAGVNNFSIGIELINSKTEKPKDDQYAALKKLIARLKSEYSIKYVLGHNQIAPGRKDDPWNFDWKKI